ncbi:MAG: B-box zinc finger protein [Promethearchaeota archaeon]
MSEQVCRFCQRYVKLAYYCEECGVSCCSDCLHEKKVEVLSCQDCNSNNIEKSDSEKKNTCKECGKENIIKVNQLLKSCPKCGSHNIINIYEKKEELEKNFLDLIKLSRSFISPLKEILDQLFLLQKEIKKARDPPIRCYHFPKMESDLLALFKLFIYVQNTLCDKTQALYKQMILNQSYFLDIYNQPNTNITIIENIYDNLVRSHSSINDFLENNFRTFKKSINSFENNLKFLEKINLYFSTYKNFLNLAEKEKPVYAIYAKLINGLNTEDKLKKDKGILFITNLDLSFVHEYGVRKKKQALIFKAPVGDLIRIKDKGKIFKKLYIEFEYGKYEFTLPPKSLSRVIEYILLARTFDETTVYDRKSATNLQRIDIDLNGLIDFIEESINSFFSLKCQYNKSYENTTNITNPPQNSHLYPNQNRNLTPQNYPYGVLYQNSNFGYPPRMQNVNYQNSGYPQYNPGQFPQAFNYNNQTGELPLPLQGQSKFFPQNIYNPNRYQNYNPQEANEVRINPYEKDILVRKLEHPRTFITQNSNYIHQDLFNDKTFQDYSKNHLSDLFNSANSPINQSYGYKRKLFKLDKEKQERMLELEKERYSLKATLKKLETKFDQGSISESDYFRTYRNLNKEIYLIDNKIQSLQQNLEELESIKQNSRSFDNKGFYT